MEIYRQLEEERNRDVEKKELIIPYIGKIQFSHTEKIDAEQKGKVLCINSDFFLSGVFKKELECIFDGQKTPSQKIFEEQLLEDLKLKLDLETIGLGEE